MARKCFISFKKEDEGYKRYIQEKLDVDMIDKSLDDPIDSVNPDYIIRAIRQDYLSDSTVTIHLIGAHSSENRGVIEQEYIKRELQSSLYHGEGNTRNGILGVVLPMMYNAIYGGSTFCQTCGGIHSTVYVNDATVVKEFSYNYYLPHNKCAWTEEDRYCVLVRWDDFISNPEQYIEQAFQKRATEISKKIKVRPE